MIVHVLEGSIALDKGQHHCYFLTKCRVLDQFEMNKDRTRTVCIEDTDRLINVSNLVTPRYIDVLCPNVSMDFLGTASIALLGESMAPFTRLFSDDVLSEAAAPLALPPPATTIGRCEPVLIESARLCELPPATVPFAQPKLLALASVLISSGCG